MTSLLPRYLSSPAVSNQGMILPPRCLSQLPKASSSSSSSPLSSTYYQISSFYLQSISPKPSRTTLQSCQREKLSLLLMFPTMQKGSQMDTFWTHLDTPGTLCSLTHFPLGEWNDFLYRRISEKQRHVQLNSFLFSSSKLASARPPVVRPFYLTWVCFTIMLLRVGEWVYLILGSAGRPIWLSHSSISFNFAFINNNIAI